MEEREINLKHLLFTICKKWKQLLACAMLGAVLLGAYGYHKGNSLVRVIDEDKFVQLEEALARQKAYLENSIFMRNPNGMICQRILHLNISVNNEYAKNIMKLFEFYVNDIQSETLYHLIANELGEKVPDYIYEVISMININQDGDLYLLRDGLYGNTVLSFMIALRGPDDKYTSKIADILGKHLENSKLEIDNLVCPHNIEIFNLGTMIIGNNAVNYAKIKNDIADLEKEISSLNGSNGKLYGFCKKWIILGFLCGFFVIAGLYALLYILSDKIHEAKEIESFWGIKTWARKPGLDKKLKDILKALVLARDDYNLVIAAGTFVPESLKSIVKEVNDELNKKLFVIYEDVINNPDAIKTLSIANAVFLLEAEEKSKIADISREVNLFIQNNIQIIGCMVEVKK